MARKRITAKKPRNRVRHACLPAVADLLAAINGLPNGFQFSFDDLFARDRQRLETIEDIWKGFFDSIPEATFSFLDRTVNAQSRLHPASSVFWIYAQDSSESELKALLADQKIK